MSCTTILVGRKASYDGSTLMARNEDSGSGEFDPKKFIVVEPSAQPRVYTSVLSGVTIELPDDPMRYTAMPNADPHEGIWGEAGVNEMNVAMSETETITSNPRVLGADPLVKNGIGEEDMLTIVLPYIRSAREGVLRLGMLLEKYGTYEMNGIGFQDRDEIWWFESIGGHHWMARKVPDDCYVVCPNQLGIDVFDMNDAMGEKLENLCSEDLADFIRNNHLDVDMDENDGLIGTRSVFGSASDSDHVYNTPRAWYMHRYLCPDPSLWDGEGAMYRPDSDDLPWCMVPQRKVTLEDIKYVLSSHYQGTKYDPYGQYGDLSEAGRFRPIGINRNNFVAVTQLRPYVNDEFMAVEWIACGSNAFNTMAPFYANVNVTPSYLSDTTTRVTTENFYWANRIIAVMADAHFHECHVHVERYENEVMSLGHEHIAKTDMEAEKHLDDITGFLEEANRAMAALLKEHTDRLLGNVLYDASMCMKNAFSRSDA